MTDSPRPTDADLARDLAADLAFVTDPETVHYHHPSRMLDVAGAAARRALAAEADRDRLSVVIAHRAVELMACRHALVVCRTTLLLCRDVGAAAARDSIEAAVSECGEVLGDV